MPHVHLPPWGFLAQASNTHLQCCSCCSRDHITPGGALVALVYHCYFICTHYNAQVLPTPCYSVLSCIHCRTVWCRPAVVCSIAELLQLTSLYLLHGGLQPDLDISHWSSLRSLAELKLLPGEDGGLNSQQVGFHASPTL